MTRIAERIYTTGDLCDWLGDTYEALRGFEIMLAPFLHEYSNASDYSYGITGLLRQQIDDLNKFRDCLRAHLLALEAQPDTAPIRPGVPEGWVTPPIIQSARDLPPELPAADPLRGADLGAVARDTNLAEATVRRVVERLLAEPRPDNPQSAASNG